MVAWKRVEFGDAGAYGYETGDNSLPAVIVLQEWWGVTDIIKDLAAKVAESGPFRVLIPDLYKGKIGLDAEEASHLMSNLDFQVAVKEIGAAAAYLKSTGSRKIGAIGFCMGGALTLAAGQHVEALDALVPCYGLPDARYFQIEAIKTPILGVFGSNDKHVGFADEATARAAEAKVNAAGGSFALHIVPDGVHGFFNQLVPGGEEVVKKNQGSLTPIAEINTAWNKSIEFLRAYLVA